MDFKRKSLSNSDLSSELPRTAGPALHRCQAGRAGVERGRQSGLCLVLGGWGHWKKNARAGVTLQGQKKMNSAYCGWICWFVFALCGGFENSWENRASCRNGRHETLRCLLPFRKDVRLCRTRNLHPLTLEILNRNPWEWWKARTVRLSVRTQEAILVITKEVDVTEPLKLLYGRKQVSDPLCIDMFSNVQLYYCLGFGWASVIFFLVAGIVFLMAWI